jgi:imidazole glycerol-phosphate synthase subunit HisF
MPLAVRVIPVVLYRGEQVVKGAGFDSWRSVGHIRQAVRLYNARGVDELFLLDIDATRKEREPDFALIRDLASDMFSPLAVGGGIRTLEHFRLALENGADKVVVNTAAIENPQLIAEASKRFGAQAVVISIDVKDGFVYSGAGLQKTNLLPAQWARECYEAGAGEILLNSVERDGTMDGYDTALIREVASTIPIPVVACGGAGKLADFSLALDFGAHGVAASAIFCFTDTTPISVSRYLRTCGYHTRVE